MRLGERDDLHLLGSGFCGPTVLTHQSRSRSVEGDEQVSIQADEVFVAGVLHVVSLIGVQIPSRARSLRRPMSATSYLDPF